MESSLDTLLACSIMIVLVLASMSSVLVTVHPYLRNWSSSYKMEVNRRSAEYLLLDPGNPLNWGSETGIFLKRFGLAESDYFSPFELDVEKVARLNQENVYHVSPLDVFKAAKVQDRLLRIRIKPLIEVTLDLASQTKEENQSIYRFNVYTKKTNSPIAAGLHCYVILGRYTVNTTSSTSTLGVGLVEIGLPNSLNGTALFMAFAKVEPRIVSYGVYAFKHNSLESPHSLGTFLRLSPLNHILRVEFLFQMEEVSSTRVLTYNYSFDLTKIANSTNVEYYGIIQLLDVSPMVLVVTGLNQSTSFVEWTSHPPLPLDFGSDFTEEYDTMNSTSFHFLVSINSVLYECEIILGEQADDA